LPVKKPEVSLQRKLTFVYKRKHDVDRWDTQCKDIKQNKLVEINQVEEKESDKNNNKDALEYFAQKCTMNTV
jgi:hypothetical protein